MIDRESQSLDLQEVRLAQKTIEIDAKCMCGEFGIETCTEAPKRMGMIGLDVELLSQLAIDGFDHLSSRIEEMLDVGRQLALLVAAWQGVQTNAIVFKQVGCLLGADVSLVPDYKQIRVFV
jgi:hypothetical protein